MMCCLDIIKSGGPPTALCSMEKSPWVNNTAYWGHQHSPCLSLHGGLQFPPASRVTQTRPSHPPPGTRGCYTLLLQQGLPPTVPGCSPAAPPVALHGGQCPPPLVCEHMWLVMAVGVFCPVSGVVCLVLPITRGQDPYLTNGANKRPSKQIGLWWTMHQIPLGHSFVWYFTKMFRQQRVDYIVLLVHPRVKPKPFQFHCESGDCRGSRRSMIHMWNVERLLKFTVKKEIPPSACLPSIS